MVMLPGLRGDCQLPVCRAVFFLIGAWRTACAVVRIAASHLWFGRIMYCMITGERQYFLKHDRADPY